MPSIDDYAAQTRAARLHRLSGTSDELDALVRAASSASITRRPAAEAWAAIEVVCHLRDSEEWFLIRCRLALEMREPPFPRNHPDRWAIDRQYLRHDAWLAAESFRRFRGETLEMFGRLSEGDWGRGGVHLDGRGRRTLDQFLSVIAWHDDNHLDQLRRALDGRP